MMRVTAIVRGRVQGVGYRYFVTDCALDTGVCGFVRNMPDGAVLIVAEGAEETLDEFIRMVRAEGEPVILVRQIEITKSNSKGEFSGFGIIW